MKLKFVAATLGVAAGLAAAPAFAAINLVNNGGFEETTTGAQSAAATSASFPPSVINAPAPGPGSFRGWTVTPGGGTTPGTGPVILATNNLPNYPYGGDNIGQSTTGSNYAAFFVDDNAGSSGSQTIFQDLNLTASGTPYTLSFDLYATGSGAANPGFFSLTSTVGTTPNVVFTETIPNGEVTVGGWENFTETFNVAADGTYRLSFTFLSGTTPSKDVLLDNVMVSPIPEPSEYAMMLAGLAAVGFIARRRRRAG